MIEPRKAGVGCRFGESWSWRPAPAQDCLPHIHDQQAIEAAVREAYRFGAKAAVQGDRVLIQGTSGGMTIQMWVNLVTETIETAYPVF